MSGRGKRSGRTSNPTQEGGLRYGEEESTEGTQGPGAASLATGTSRRAKGGRTPESRGSTFDRAELARRLRAGTSGGVGGMKGGERRGGYRKGYAKGRVRTGAGMLRVQVPQIRGQAEP